MPKAAQKFIDKCKTFWDDADTDESGNLTVQELAKLIRHVYPNSASLTDADIAKIFACIDVDGDRIMSYEEFSEVFLKKDPKCVQKQELKEAFSEMDKDGSGCLTAEEIKGQFCSLGVQLSDEEIDTCLAKADTDGSGNISVKEFMDAWGDH